MIEDVLYIQHYFKEMQLYDNFHFSPQKKAILAQESNNLFISKKPTFLFLRFLLMISYIKSD